MLCIAAIVATLPLTTACAQKNHRFDVAKNLDIFNSIYKNLDLMYVDTIDAEEVVGKTAIKAMLGSLDPYTQYFPADKTEDLKMMFTGKYAGIGALVKYHFQKKRVVIDEPYADMPAAQVGLQKGDIILAIDDSSMIDKNVSQVSERLRGNANTTFKLTVERPSTGKKMDFRITRKNIKLPELPYYGMLADSVGYIDFNQYTEGSAKDMRRAFVGLRQQGAKALILDLRSNGGGAINEAIDICNMWIPKGQMLVETRGKLKQANRKYKTRLEPIDTVMPIVVLVNGETASASEITCGSIQDLDRGVVMGTRTYGKGLVQLALDLPYNANLKMTTSRYHIPSGRCIQAINYKHTGGGYREHIPDSLTKLFHTANGREVRDGGGIKPDVEVKADTMTNLIAHITGSDWAYQRNIDSTMVMFDYEVDYIARHPQIAPPAEFHLTDADFEEFKQRVIKSGFSFDSESKECFNDLVKEAKFEGYYDDAKAEFDALEAKLKHNLADELDRNKDDLMKMLELDIISHYYHQSGAIEAALQYDTQLKEAQRLLAHPDEYRALLQPQKKKEDTVKK